MSPEERQLLTALFDRVQAASSTPRDHEAEALIGEQTRRQPYAAYYLAQAVIIQEKGLEAASNRIQELEARLHELESGGPDHEARGGGFLGSIFGNSEPPRQDSIKQRDRIPLPNPPSDGEDRAVYRPPQPLGGPWGGGPSFGNQSFDNQPAAASIGGSFLRGALGTAAGVAGGMLLANSLSGIFGNHMAGMGWGPAGQNATVSGTEPIEETVINNYYGDNTANGDDHQDNGDISQADHDNDDFDDGSSDFDSSNDSLDA